MVDSIWILTIANNTQLLTSRRTSRCWKYIFWLKKYNFPSKKLKKQKYKSFTHLWCGPFGARIGIAIPTNPQRAVIKNTGIAPILTEIGGHNYSTQNIFVFNISWIFQSYGRIDVLTIDLSTELNWVLLENRLSNTHHLTDRPRMRITAVYQCVDCVVFTLTFQQTAV